MERFQAIQEELSEIEPEALYADGFEAALIGYVTRIGGLDGAEALAVYDYDACVSILMDRDGMSDEEAVEYMDFNVTGAYVGKGTPCFLRQPLFFPTISILPDPHNTNPT